MSEEEQLSPKHDSDKRSPGKAANFDYEVLGGKILSDVCGLCYGLDSDGTPTPSPDAEDESCFDFEEGTTSAEASQEVHESLTDRPEAKKDTGQNEKPYPSLPVSYCPVYIPTPIVPEPVRFQNKQQPEDQSSKTDDLEIDEESKRKLESRQKSAAEGTAVNSSDDTGNLEEGTNTAHAQQTRSTDVKLPEEPTEEESMKPCKVSCNRLSPQVCEEPNDQEVIQEDKSRKVEVFLDETAVPISSCKAISSPIRGSQQETSSKDRQKCKVSIDLSILNEDFVNKMLSKCDVSLGVQAKSVEAERPEDVKSTEMKNVISDKGNDEE